MNWPVRLCVSALLLTGLLWVLPSERIWTAIRGVRIEVWAGVLVAFLAGHVVAAIKWRWLTALDGDIPLVASLRAHFAGLVANLCLPGVAGGDLVRAAWIMRNSRRKEAIAVASVADRLVDCAALVALACAGALAASTRSDGVGIVILASCGMLVTAVASFIVAHRLLRRRSGVAHRTGQALAELARRPLRLAGCFALSMTVQGTFVALNIVLGEASGVRVEPAAWFVAWPLAKLIATLPISLAGLGVRESSLAALLRPFGGNPELVVAAGLAWTTVLFAGGIVGGLVVALSRPASAAQKEQEMVAAEECLA